MATPVKLPELGESVTEGTITRWLKSVGDQVEVDEPLLEVSTDKVDTEIPSPVAGTLLEIKAEEDETVEVGAELAVIGDSDEAPSDDGGDESADEDAADEDDEDEDQSDAGEEQDADASSSDEADSEEKPAAKQSGGGGGGSGDGTPVKLPELGESVTEGTITRWLKSVGDEVEVDEPLLEVSTDKVDTEIPSPVAGTLLEIKVEEDETVEVGAELAVIGSGEPSSGGSDDGGADEGEEPAPEPEPEPSDEDKGEEKAEEKAGPETEKKPEPKAQEKDGGDKKSDDDQPSAYVTPLVRKLAADHGVDLSTIEGTGVGGRIRKQDVLDAAKSAQEEPAAKEEPAKEEKPAAPAAKEAPSEPSPLRGRTEKMSRLRKVIAQRMVESLQVSAQLTTVVEVDVTAIARLRQAKKDEFHRREGVKLSFMPFFAKAAIDALKAHPALNAGIDTEKGEITYYDYENLAIAVDTEKGLLTPVIKNAGDLNVAGLARNIADLAERTRVNKIKPDELAGGTFTLTNTGSRGALFDTPIINQPQVAILGTGSVVKRPVVIDDPNLGETIAVRQMVYLALTYDHRLVDGADAARFLSEVKQRLESGRFEV